MDAQLKSRWLDALRGGQYRQGKGQLLVWERFDEDGNRLGEDDVGYDAADERPTYCCLGVLCALLDGKVVDGERVLFQEGQACYGDDVEEAYIPTDLANAIGLPPWSHEFRPAVDCHDPLGFAQNILAEKNDAGEPFGAIADWIEENL